MAVETISIATSALYSTETSEVAAPAAAMVAASRRAFERIVAERGRY